MNYKLNKTDLNRIWGRKHIEILPVNGQQYTSALEIAMERQVTPTRPRLSFDLVDKSTDEIILQNDASTGAFVLTPNLNIEEEIPTLEALCMSLTQACKIPVVPSLLIPDLDQKLVFIAHKNYTKYDNSVVKDIHSIMGVDSQDYYDSTYEEMAEIIRQETYNPTLEIVRFYEVLLVGYILGHSDMHLKSFSINYNTNERHNLAPVYDMIALNITSHSRSEQMAMTLNGKTSGIKLSDFLQSMEQAGVSERASFSMIVRIATGLKRWKGIIDGSILSSEIKNQLLLTINKNALNMGMKL